MRKMAERSNASARGLVLARTDPPSSRSQELFRPRVLQLVSTRSLYLTRVSRLVLVNNTFCRRDF